MTPFQLQTPNPGPQTQPKLLLEPGEIVFVPFAGHWCKGRVVRASSHNRCLSANVRVRLEGGTEIGLKRDGGLIVTGGRPPAPAPNPEEGPDYHVYWEKAIGHNSSRETLRRLRQEGRL